ncbi:MAG: TetR/AcrR family transcriptional regulator [Butyricicoccaceae bacterium]
MGTYTKKEQQIFQGVLRLIQQGVDLHTVKVQDIATAAGIGKGTLYEYFSSKEEIITKTLSYLYLQEIEFFEHIIQEQKHFDDVIRLVIEHVAHSPLPAARTFHAVFIAYPPNASIHQQLSELYYTRFIQAAMTLTALGRKDGVIAETCTDEYCLFVIRAASFNLISSQLCGSPDAQQQEHFIKLFHNAFMA